MIWGKPPILSPRSAGHLQPQRARLCRAPYPDNPLIPRAASDFILGGRPTGGGLLTAKTLDTDFLDGLRAAEGCDGLFDCLERRLQNHGIGGFGYGFVPMRTERGIETDMKDLHFHHTYPDGWEQAGGAAHPLDNDPAAQLLFAGVREVDWTTAGQMAPIFGPASQQVYQARLDLGMRFGVTLRAAEDGRGRMLSGLCLWFSDRPDRTAFRADWSRSADEIRRIMYLFDTVARGDRAATLLGLSGRERDTLSYLAAGYRSAEASWKMRISEKTFEKHVAHAKAKLNARTRDHAIAKALVMGLIEP